MPNGSQIAPNAEAPSAPRRIVLVGYPGAQSLDLIGPLEVFSMSNHLGEAKVYDIVLASPQGGEILCNSGVRLGGAVALEELSGEIDTLLVAGGHWPSVQMACDGEVPAWLCAHHERVRRIGSVCSGSFILAASEHIGPSVMSSAPSGPLCNSRWMRSSSLTRRSSPRPE